MRRLKSIWSKTSVPVRILMLFMLAVISFERLLPPKVEAFHGLNGYFVTAYYKGLHLIPHPSSFGDNVVRVDVVTGGNSTMYCTKIRGDTCSFIEKCSDGRIIREGKCLFVQQELSQDDELGGFSVDGMPQPRPYSMISGVSYDESGSIIGRLEDGNGSIRVIDCRGGKWEFTYKNGLAISSQEWKPPQ